MQERVEGFPSLVAVVVPLMGAQGKEKGAASREAGEDRAGGALCLYGKLQQRSDIGVISR